MTDTRNKPDKIELLTDIEPYAGCAGKCYGGELMEEDKLVP